MICKQHWTAASAFSGRALKTAFLGLIKIYQTSLRPHFMTGCYFHPTCSEYARMQIEQKGAIKALPFICWRLMRCHPMGKKTKHVIIEWPS